MSTTKPQLPVTNLKERIAALEQKNAANGQRSGSPSVGAGAATVGGLRDKIAKFEKKGGVPVPRGRFGLGAPPPAEAQVKGNRELYGNRIPQPVRMVSANATLQSRSGSSMGFHDESSEHTDNRRSFSMSSVISDLDDGPDYTPLTSPTFAFPPDSPDSTTSTTSPTLSTTSEPPAVKAPIATRSTAFATAVEFARKAAETKGSVGTLDEAAVPTPFIINTHVQKSELDDAEQTPTASKHADSPLEVVNGTVSAIAEESQNNSSSHNPDTSQSKSTLPRDPPTPVTPEPSPVYTLDGPVVPKAGRIPAPAEVAAPTTADLAKEAAPAPSVVKDAKDVSLHSAVTPLPSVPPTPIITVVPPIASPSSVPEMDTTRATKPLVEESLSTVSSALERSPSTKSEPSQKSQRTHDQEVKPSIEQATTPPVKKGLSKSNNLTLDVELLGNGASVPLAEGTTDNNSTPPTDNTTPTTANRPDLLSSLPSGVSGVLSGGSSVGSDSLVSPRPYSMIDISWAERVTPATSRGNVMFIPPSTVPLPRISDLVNFPPTPAKDETDFGTVTLQPDGQGKSSQPVKSARPVTFSAVVHKKVREPSEEATLEVPSALPETPRINREKRKTMIMPPVSPGYGELSSLIESAVLLETSLEHGELPTESAKKQEDIEKERKEQQLFAALAADKAKADEAAQKKLAFEDVRKEEESTAGKLRHTFLIPLSRARSQHKKEASTSDIDSYTKPSNARPKSTGPPASGSMREKFSRLTMMPETRVPDLPPPPPPSVEAPAPPKSAGSKSRFSTFRRLGSMKNAGSANASRHSHSSEVSEDSVPSVITPDASVDHGLNEFGQFAGGNGTSWPSLSPKKSSGGISRASSLAEKMFSRSRTKSSGSTLSNMSAASTYTLPPLPDSLSVIPPSPEFEEKADPKPRRSISLKSLKLGKNPPPSAPLPSRAAQPPLPQSAVAPSNSPTSTLGSPGYLKSPDFLGQHASSDDSRPTSWMSVSSLASTLPSPLFEKDIFDAFPAVPASTPSGPGYGYAAHTSSVRDFGLSSAAMTPSFDSDFLSSAIHLAGAHKSTPTGHHSPLPPPSATGSAMNDQVRRPSSEVPR